MVDQVANFKKVTVSTGYNNTATSIVLTTGQGAELPDPSGDNYNLIWYDSTNYPDPADDPNVEIVRVTAKSSDTLTVIRNQEGSGASNKNNSDATYKMILGVTAKTITDVIAIANATGMNEQSFTNLLENGDFESWSSGASAAPDGWTIEAGTIARESTTIKIGTYSLKITTAASTIRQIIPLTTFPDSTGKATIGMWIKSDSSNTHITLHVDGVGGVSTYHSGSGSWEFVTVTRTLNAGTNLEASLYSHDTVNCYIDGAILVEGSVCPAFSPKPLVNDGIMLQSNTPSAANDYGKAGQWCYDASYIYICTATDTWKRAAIATW